jgi:hypothetical protein
MLKVLPFRRWQRLAFSLAGLLLFVACSSAPAPTASTGGRYSIQQDRAPSRDVKIAAIPEVVPGADKSHHGRKSQPLYRAW